MNPHTTTNNNNQNTLASGKGLFGVGVKIHILFPFQEGPKGGGGNQFLKALKYNWQSFGAYEDSIEKADVILFNSHHCLKQVFSAKKKFPQKIFIHRIDGPLRTYRKKEAFLDKLIFGVNSFVADGIVWQSKWSQAENKKIFRYKCQNEIVIYNAPNEQIFNKKNKTALNPKEKIKLVAVSWSNSALKGFDIYKFLDDNLNFKKYQMAFIGRSPVKFKNIKMIEPVEQEKLAGILKQNDIFVTASKIESCSNALIEALSCGLPCLAFNSSSNPEIIGAGGELFESGEDLLKKIDKVASNYLSYQKNLPIFSLNKVSQDYFKFANKIFEDAKSGFYTTREVGVQARMSFALTNFFAKINRILNKFKK
ncbi:MAG: glycosyltransferase family 4 protein [Patescibacteria group bacterium]